MVNYGGAPLNILSKKIKLFPVFLFYVLWLQSCALQPSKEEQREMAFNMVSNVMTIKAAASAYSVTKLFSFSSNKILENFNRIATRDISADMVMDETEDKSKEFAALTKNIPAKLLMVIAQIQPKMRELVLLEPDRMDAFVITDDFQQGLLLSDKATEFGLPDLTKTLDDKQVGLWVQVFMSTKQKPSEIAEPLSDWGKQVEEYFNPKV